MAWFRRSSDDRDGPKRKVVIAEGLWIKCDSCKEIVYRAEIERAGKVCPKCRYGFRISARERIAQLGLEASINSPEEFAVVIKTDTAKWAKVIRDANIQRQ